MRKIGHVGQLATAGVVMLLLAVPASAVPTLRILDGATTMVADGSLSDLEGAPGAVVFSGATPNWDVNVVTGLTKPVLTGTELMDLLSVNVTSAGSASITLQFSETDFTGPAPGSLLSAIGGTTSGMVEFNTYFGASNALFDTSQLIQNQLFDPLNVNFGGNGLAPLPIHAGPYSLTMEVVITHDLAPGEPRSTSFDANVSMVPEPSAVILFGLGGLALVTRRLRRR